MPLIEIKNLGAGKGSIFVGNNLLDMPYSTTKLITRSIRIASRITSNGLLYDVLPYLSLMGLIHIYNLERFPKNAPKNGIILTIKTAIITTVTAMNIFLTNRFDTHTKRE